MKCFCGPPPRARGIMGSRALWALLFVLKLQENHGNEVHELPGPQAVKLETDWELQRISVSWEQRPLTHNLTDQLLFDIEVLRNKKTVHSETIEPNPVLKRQQWNWTSDIPLNCTSHCARVRTRLLNRTSHWSFTQTADGMDVSSHKSLQVFPSTDRVVEVGSSVDYCCIMSEGHTNRTSHHITYNLIAPAVTRISDRSFAVHLRNLAPTKTSGNHLQCDASRGADATLFVGYPPSVRNLVCETDLVNLTCHWDLERDTELYGERKTLYSLNGRNCKDENILKQCMISVALGPGEKNWTLTARNRLGSMELTDRADLRHRGRLRQTSPFNDITKSPFLSYSEFYLG
ncbi:leukemia inhibitory factor receptor-like [Conger conger]|uniref:leukemia inhibitory factor receptor-like n=1 Tax=Conger conger TaxID=82655 RepID=UPI002A5AD9E9|nr:leukemia inhibitory factor receptor-like [Conger conger]